MLILGLNGNFSAEDADLVPGMLEFFCHDASASLVKDGALLAAVEEERLNRIKKTTKFPINAIRSCLAKANVLTSNVDAVAYYFPEDHTDSVLNQLYTDNPLVPTRYSRQLIKDRLKAEFGWEFPDDRLIYVPHHLSHAMSTFVRSGLKEALVVVMDGMGEECSGSVFRAVDGRLESLTTYSISKSLGMLYLSGTRQLGYKFGDEYKVMGLAPYGDSSVYRKIFDSMYSLGEKGDYDLAPSNLGLNNVGPTFFAHGITPRRKGEEFTQQHMDFAAGLQEMVEKIVLHVLSYWAEFTGLSSLAFGGGVAHNCSLNGVILRSGLFKEMFVHPASHDSGAGEGAALAAEYELVGAVPPQVRIRSASVGPTLGAPHEIEEKLTSWRPLIEFERRADIVDATAILLTEGAVFGWAQGGSEFGPRALGNRSIIADARPKENQTRINAMVKKRESFRPFAPVVIPQAARTYFEIPDTAANYDFMSFVVRVRQDRRKELGAVTHVDGTARVQIIDPQSNERFYRLVEHFGVLTGTPVLLNTSFNNNAEPIVQSVEDALTCFLTSGLDYLVIEDFLIRRRPGCSLGFDDFVLQFRPVTRLAKNMKIAPSGKRVVSHEIHLDYSTGPSTTVSPELFALLERVDGVSTLGSLAAINGGMSEEIRRELTSLWQERFFALIPA
ncbi:MAG: carbamoyltransferase [Pseudonocardiales bacterium]|nr:carbamoyltransferase [Pseudonocardiales bacterium]